VIILNKLVTKEYSKKNFDILHNEFEYHCVYILENGEKAYIGETRAIAQRAAQHDYDIEAERNYVKQIKFDRIHVIGGENGEATPAEHFEYLLIKLMQADKKFEVINRKNVKMPHYGVVRTGAFEECFDGLWPDLVKAKLFNANAFKDVTNLSVYKHSPYVSLTAKQEDALNMVLRVLNSGELEATDKRYKNRVALIDGNAGTGKTVVAVRILYHLKNDRNFEGKKIALVYSQPAMRKKIQSSINGFEGLKTCDVIAPIDVTKQKYDILICDEAHRLRRGKGLGNYFTVFKQGNDRIRMKMGCDRNDLDELDWILENSDYQVLFYDNKQIIGPADVDNASFEERVGISSTKERHGFRKICLNEQLRIKAGDEYVPYIFNILWQRSSEKKSFSNYDFKLFDSFGDMIHLIREKEEATGLSRLCGGYAWKWSSKDKDITTDITIDGIKIKWNSQTGGWLDNQMAKDEMGSIYTLAGLDLNYAGVVIGPDLFFDEIDNTIKVRKENVFDNVVKGIKDPDEIKKYILNIYAVLLTRGILGTYVYVCDNKLRAYFKQYIDM